jgi:hypothetical protein
MLWLSASLVCGLLCIILTAIQSTWKSARLPGPLPQQSSYQLLGPEWQSMGDFALGHYPTHGLVGLLTCEYWQEPWNIHRWMTALLRSGRRRVFVAYFLYRLGADIRIYTCLLHNEFCYLAENAITFCYPTVMHEGIDYAAHEISHLGFNLSGGYIPAKFC